MPKVVYTEDVSVKDSSLVDEAFYNENTGDLYVDLNDTVYLYSGVSREVVDAFENADSAGHFYATRIKGQFPSTMLGHWSEMEYEDVDAYGKAEEPTPTYTLNINSSVSGGSLMTPTEVRDKVFSLKPFYGADAVERVEGNEREYAVRFVVDGGSDVKTHKVKADSLDNAVDQTLAVGTMLDLDFRVTEVTVYFE